MVDVLLLGGIRENRVLLQNLLLVARHLRVGPLFARILIVKGILVNLRVKARQVALFELGVILVRHLVVAVDVGIVVAVVALRNHLAAVDVVLSQQVLRLAV